MAEHLNGMRKSAIVLLALGRQQAETILQHLGEDAAANVVREMATAQSVDPQERAATLGDFVQSCAGQHVQQTTTGGPFASFHGAETQTLLDSIRDEHPQTIALVLAHLPPAKAGEILAGLPAAKQVEVIKRIAGIEQTSSQVIEQVEQGLRQRLGHIVGRTIRSGGVSAVAEILNSADRRTEREILHSLDSDSPALADRIRRVQGILDDLLRAPDNDIRAVLEQLDVETISRALRTARERLVRKVLWNLPPDEAARIEEDLQSAEPVLISDIEAAQHRVAEVVERLNATGEISVLGQISPRPARA